MKGRFDQNKMLFLFAREEMKKFEYLLLSERRQLEMATYCVNPAMWHFGASNLWRQ